MYLAKKKLKEFLAIGLGLLAITSFAQPKNDSSFAGQFSFGMRNTISFFSDAKSMGMGSGGEFRIRIGKHLNTEWFWDYITTNIQNLGYRRDAHIGWSVLFYLNKNPLSIGTITPYVLAGNCFDYTKVFSNWETVSPEERWSGAVQAGGGIHYNFTKNFDISIITQYMLHLGTHVETSVLYDEVSHQNYLDVTKLNGGELDGHLLITLSVNYLLGKL